jgi:hypothetical protein
MDGSVRMRAGEPNNNLAPSPCFVLMGVKLWVSNGGKEQRVTL